jgi:mRNA interferase MazF
VLQDWASAGLNVPTAVKRGIYTVSDELIIKSIGTLAEDDAEHLKKSVVFWLGWVHS